LGVSHKLPVRFILKHGIMFLFFFHPLAGIAPPTGTIEIRIRNFQVLIGFVNERYRNQ
jgi:hypothetical protein